MKFLSMPKKVLKMGKILGINLPKILLFQFWSISGFEDIPKLDLECCKVQKYGIYDEKQTGFILL